MRLVLDTNVVASALLWGGVPRLLLQAARDERVTIFTSGAMLAELTGILGRRKFDQKIAASMLTVDQLVDGYVALAALVRPVPTPRIAPDPDDDIVIGTAWQPRHICSSPATSLCCRRRFAGLAHRQRHARLAAHGTNLKS